MLSELDVELVEKLGSASGGSVGRGEVDEGESRLEWPDGHFFLFHLRFQEAASTLHLVEPANVSDKRALEGGCIRIELRWKEGGCQGASYKEAMLGKRTHIFELHIAQLSKFSHGRVRYFSRDVELNKRHAR